MNQDLTFQPSELSITPVQTPEQAQELGKIIAQSFNASPEDWPFYVNLLGIENFRIATQNQQVLGGVGLISMGQWFGGNSLTIAGIASVGIAPEYRGQGVAAKMLSQTLKELATAGLPLSTLYASTSTLYRKVGYEQAGNYHQWAVPVDTIRLQDHSLPMQEIKVEDFENYLETFQSLYSQQACQNNGNLNRTSVVWNTILKNKDQPIYAYGIGHSGSLEGYVIFHQKTSPHSQKYNLFIRDMVALTAGAKRRLLTFFADHRSLVHEVQWYGMAIDPLLSFLPEQTARVNRSERWLLRILNLSHALENRGYSPALNAELHLGVQDEVLPHNQGNWILKISQGKAEVTPGGRGDLTLSIRALAPLYSSLFSPYQLQGLNQLSGTPEALLTATQIFAGTEPWMPDHF